MTTHKKLPQRFLVFAITLILCTGTPAAYAQTQATAEDPQAAMEGSDTKMEDSDKKMEASAMKMEGSNTKIALKKGGMKAQCVLSPTEGNRARGIITFTETDEGVYIEGIVTGLDADAKHGFHIHQYGDISAPDGSATGGHYNPEGNDHAGPDDAIRHIGDLGNIVASDKGIGTYHRLIKGGEVGGKHGIIGRGMIVHAGTDDLKSQPTGAAGGRIAQGIIAIIKSK